MDASFADYAYATQSVRQKMDIYLPSNKSEVNVILFIHGGGWSTGDKMSEIRGCKRCVELGYAAASMNYRMIRPIPYLPLWLQPATYKDMLDDIGIAIAALKAKLVTEGYVPKKLAITGWSSGGHLTMLYGYSRHQQSAIPIAFMATATAPTNFLDAAYRSLHSECTLTMLVSVLAGQKISIQDVVNQVSVLRDMSPLCSIVPGVPPTLMRYGAKDEMIPLSQGIAAQAALDATNVHNDLLIYPNSGHDLDDPSDAGMSDVYMAKLQEYISRYFSS